VEEAPALQLTSIITNTNTRHCHCHCCDHCTVIAHDLDLLGLDLLMLAM
jgi:hypothetical protein